MWTYAILAIVWFMLMQELMETRTGVMPISFSKPSAELAVPTMQSANAQALRPLAFH